MKFNVRDKKFLYFILGIVSTLIVIALIFGLSKIKSKSKRNREQLNIEQEEQNKEDMNGKDSDESDNEKTEDDSNSNEDSVENNNPKQIIGYITQWDAFKDENAGVPSKGALTHLNVDITKYTILNFSFFGVAKDGSIHSGDYKNKKIYERTEVQEPAPILNTDVYSSWDLYLLYGELENIHYINAGVVKRAEEQGFDVVENGTTWTNSNWGVYNHPLPLPLKKEGGAPGLFEVAKENNVKLMASIGGWSMSKHFPEMAADETMRARFIEDCKKLIAMGFDGIDLDWEYPGPSPGMNFNGGSSDYANFAILAKEIREAIGEDKLITSCFSAVVKKVMGFDWQEIDKYVDYFNFMTYDYNGGWSGRAGHNTPLYDYKGAESSTFNIDTLHTYLIKKGVNKNKINIGLAFYGRGVITNEKADLNVLTVKTDHFVEPDGPIKTSADYDNWTKGIHDGAPNYYYIHQNLLKEGSGWIRHWDDEAKVPYLTKDNYFLSYDDEESIEYKAKYVVDNGLAGVIVWNVYGDLIFEGSPVEYGDKLKKWPEVKSPLINKVNEVFGRNNDIVSNNEDEFDDIETMATDSQSPWESSRVYLGGDRISHKGIIWEAKWWTQGEEPKAEDDGSVWKKIGEVKVAKPPKKKNVKDDTNSKSSSKPLAGTTKLKIVGYYPSWQPDKINQIQYNNLTHINYSFAIPTAEGGLRPLNNPNAAMAIIKEGHKNGVKVLIAVGGWSFNDTPLEGTFVQATNSSEKIKKLTKAIMKMVDEYGFDGVDMDWEHPRTGSTEKQYEELILSLSKALKKKNKLLSSAVLSGVTADGNVFYDSAAHTDKVLAACDFINVMAYDGGDGERHSSFEFAKNSAKYWKEDRKLPAYKVVLGVPFYGRPSWASYDEILKADSNGHTKDIATINGMEAHYNGMNTIKKKSKWACENVGGIMIWEISQDTTDAKKSLLNTIAKVVKEYSKK